MFRFTTRVERCKLPCAGLSRSKNYDFLKNENNGTSQLKEVLRSFIGQS